MCIGCTYIKLQHEHIYLGLVIDHHIRKCIGWELSRSLGGTLAMNPLFKALGNRWSESPTCLVHNFNQAVQYTSKYYLDCLKYNIHISMTWNGNPYNNAYANSLIKAFKIEEADLNEYGTFEDAYEKIWHFIEKFYKKRSIFVTGLQISKSVRIGGFFKYCCLAAYAL